MDRRFPTTEGGVSITQDITTESCRDGPLELRLRERLERHFPEEEEVRTYYTEPPLPDTEQGDGTGVATELSA
ncbi:hypothetical protein DL93DRAFT_2081728, partial [Clavulina sp. PMI_390]